MTFEQYKQASRVELADRLFWLSTQGKTKRSEREGLRMLREAVIMAEANGVRCV